MKNYYIAKVRVIIDGEESVIETVSGQGYNPNMVKESAENRVRKHNQGKKITSVIVSKVDLDIDEYKKAIGGTPPWLG